MEIKKSEQILSGAVYAFIYSMHGVHFIDPTFTEPQKSKQYHPQGLSSVDRALPGVW